MNRRHNIDQSKYRQPAYGPEAGHTHTRTAHCEGDRFGQQFHGQTRTDSAPSHGSIVGRQGESVGSYGSNRAVMNFQSFDTTIPISEVNPYTHNWSILGRCTMRAEIRKFTNSSGEGQVFSFDLIDANCGEIRCTTFGEAVNRIHPLIEVGLIYHVAKCQVNKRSRYCNLDHDFELRLDNQTKIEIVPEQSVESAIPTINYKFKKIDEIKDMQANSIVDVVGILVSVEPSRTVIKKNGNEVQLRKFAMKDDSNFVIDVSLWDDLAVNIGKQIEALVNDNQNHIIAAKGVRVGDFNGVSLNSMPSTHIKVDVDVPEANRLREWAMRSGNSLPTQTLRQTTGENLKKRSFLADITLNSMPPGKPSYDTVLATVTYVKDNSMYYAACPLQRNNRQCSKKLFGEDPNFNCEACGQNIEEPNWKYCLSLGLRDHTDSRFVTVFDVAEEILGISAKDLRSTKDTPSFASHIEKVRFKTGVFTLRSAMDEWNGDVKLKTQLFRQDEIDFVKETGNLLKIIEEYEADEERVPKPFHPDSVIPGTPPGSNYGIFTGPAIAGGRHYG